MVGAKTGIATHINEIELHAHLRHCYGYALQLAVGETIKAIKIMWCTVEAACQLLNKLIKYSMVTYLPYFYGFIEKMKY